MKSHITLVIVGLVMIWVASSSLVAAVSAASFHHQINWTALYVIHAALLLGSLSTIVYAIYVESKKSKKK